MSEATLSKQLAQYVCNLSFDDLTQEHIKKTKIYLLDWLGSAFAGKTEKPTHIMIEVARSMGGKPESTIIPDGSKTMCLLAALVNGASSHVVEMDDLHRESILHPAAPIMPAVFALAERENSSGRDIILAISAGYETGIRIAVAIGPSHYHFWHTTATCGTFGAAAGAAKILGLDEEHFVWALGSAGTQAAGLWEFLGESAMSKQLHPGKAAMNGLLASLLAQKGFTGASKILEGEKGLFRATSQDFSEEKCVAGLGKEFFSERNSIKYYASCGHTHSAVDAVLKATGGRPMMVGEIKRIDVSVYQASLDLLGDVMPTTPYLAKFNLPFCVATALIYGHVNLGDFSSERIGDPDIHRVMDLINLRSDPELSRCYPRKWPARVEIFTRDGRRLEASNDHPKGDPENPLGEADVIEKFKALTNGLISVSTQEGIVERVLNLEEMADINMLLT